MKIRLHQLNPTVGDIERNKRDILSALKQAEKDGIGLLILPEMNLTGYPVQDLLEKPAFRKACYRANSEIIDKVGGTALLFGSITPNEKEAGRKMFNSAILAKDSEQIGIAHKTLLPTYDVFDDLRYFEPNTVFECLELDGIKLGVTICEDIWYNENEVQYHLYETDPAAELVKKGAQVVINISASPYTQTKHENRVSMLSNHAESLGVPVLYCNQIGAHTDIIFEGDSMAISPDRAVVANTKAFEVSSTDILLDEKSNQIKKISEEPDYAYPESADERSFLAIKRGLYDYFDKTGAGKKVVLGLSGGIDSALVCALATETFGVDNITAITLPSEFSSIGSVTDSEKLAENLGVKLYEIPIKGIYNEFNSSLEPLFKDLPFGVAEENLQSRIRGTLLMAYSNKFGDFLLATGNKSEYAVGYATLYGDMNGALAIIGDLYKTEVYSLARWMNEHYYKCEMIPNSIINKPPSAELRPDQKDSDSLPDYSVLDSILYQYLELQKSVEQIESNEISKTMVQKIVKMVDRNEFKRFQAAPILKLSSKTFGTGRRWPLVQRWTHNQF